MASGSTLSVTGGTSMVQVVAGTDNVAPADYDNMVANLNRQLNVPADVTLGTYSAGNTYGYNQSALTLDAATGETISASNSSQGYKNLQDEAQALSTFTGVSLFSSSSTDKAAGDSITASDWNNLMTDTKSLFDARLSIPSGSLTTDSSGTTTRTAGWGSSSTPQITHTFTHSFSSEAHCRAFFNAGGEVLFTGARSGGTSGSGAGSIGSQNTNLSLIHI